MILGSLSPFSLCSPPPTTINHGSVIVSRCWLNTSAICHQSHPVVLITGRPTGAAPSPLPPKMSAGALRVWFVFALRLGCVTPLAIPQDRGQRGRQAGSDSTMNTNEKRGALFHLSDLPRGPAVAPHKKAPQFMLDLFNAVSVSKSQKDILNGNIVRSFEDKGEEMQHLRTDCSHIFF